MGALVDRLAAYFLPLALIAAAALAVLLGIQTVRVSGLRADIAVEQRDRAKETAERERIAREATARIAALQAQHAAEQQRLSDGFEKERAALSVAAAAARVAASRMRRDVEDFLGSAARPVDPPNGPAAGVDPGDRAATLGQLFREADGLAESLARAAERHAAEVRALKAQIKADRETCQGVR